MNVGYNMGSNNVNILVGIEIHKFQITQGIYSLTDSNRNVSIRYTGVGDPISTADLSIYQYSSDSGISWQTMSVADGTIITNLSFTPTGNELIFTWRIKDDIGENIYNKDILVRIQATSESLSTILTPFSLYFSKIVVNAADANKKPPLPNDYEGIPGWDLLSNAPKAKK
jgi:hypothetical protein